MLELLDGATGLLVDDRPHWPPLPPLPPLYVTNNDSSHPDQGCPEAGDLTLIFQPVGREGRVITRKCPCCKGES